jgi:hypothetical protein
MGVGHGFGGGWTSVPHLGAQSHATVKELKRLAAAAGSTTKVAPMFDDELLDQLKQTFGLGHRAR